jgi:hypothetical protein
MKSSPNSKTAKPSAAKLTPLMIFALETYVNTGAKQFGVGDRLFEAQIHPRHLTHLGPMEIIFMKGTPSKNWRLLCGVGNYRITYEFRNEEGRKVRISLDWLDIEDEYK